MTGREPKQAAEFFEILFGDAQYNEEVSSLNFLIWTLQGKRSHWFEVGDFNEAIDLANNQEEKDIYLGVGLSPEKKGIYERCRANEVAGIFGVWVDLDVMHAAHKKQNLFPNERSAQRFLDQMGPEPTLVINSGHGLQAWWLFNEPWIFEDDEEREKAAKLAREWNNTARLRAEEMDYEVDSTHDLSRVLRVPGTMNLKKEPVPVLIVNKSGRRYTPDDFDTYVLDEARKEIPALRERLKVGSIVIDPGAQPPFDKFAALQAIEPRFVASCNRSRDDLQDQSRSGYDMSLATFAAMAKWSDQEIVDLLIAMRRQNGEEIRQEEKYYLLTIANARRVTQKKTAEKNIEDMMLIDEEDMPETGEDRGTKREAMLQNISIMFGLRITSIVKYLSSDPQYRLKTEKGTIMLGDVNNLIVQRKLRTKIAAVADHYLPSFSKKKWESIAQVLLNVCEHEEVGLENTDEGAVQIWIDMYLTDNPPADEMDESVLLAQSPYKGETGNIYIFGSSMRDWLLRRCSERINAKTFGGLMRHYKADPETINCTIRGKHTTRSVWRIPSWKVREADDGEE